MCVACSVWSARGALVLSPGQWVFRELQILVNNAVWVFLMPAVAFYLISAESKVGDLFLSLLSAVFLVQC